MSDTTVHSERLTWPAIIASLLRGEALSARHTSWAMGEIMSGEASPSQIAGFAIALRAKGETAEEVVGLVGAMLDHATRVPVEVDAADVVGTGGDGANTVNISTMAAMVVAGAGVPVVKHGNRAASSSCGAADLLEALGVRIDLGPDEVSRCVTEAGIGFCFAPRFHPGLRHAAVTRRELRVPTVFNCLGPLTNPAQPRSGAFGCADVRMAPVLAGVLARRGASAAVMRGDDGLDEFTTGAPTHLWIVHNGEFRRTVLDAEAFGIPRSAPDALRGGDATHNAEVARGLLAGTSGPVRDAVVINAAVALAAHTGFGDGSDVAVSVAVRNGIGRAKPHWTPAWPRGPSNAGCRRPGGKSRVTDALNAYMP